MSEISRTQVRKRVALALGSGAARGLSHIGVIHALHEMGVEPEIVCGTSIGALVGAAYAAGHLDALESWVRELSAREVVYYLDVRLTVAGGLTDGRRLIDYFRDLTGDPRIEDLDKPFAAVATDLQSGREVWLRSGSLWDAVRASIALPGVVSPAVINGRWLLDGGLVNPVPVSLCRALEAEAVIAVNLNGDIVGRHLSKRHDTADKNQKARKVQASDTETAGSLENFFDRLSESVKERATALLPANNKPQPDLPGLFEVITSAVNIMQDRITRSRMAGDPPDVVIAPRLAEIGLLEFHRADEAIELGYASVQRMTALLQDALGGG